MGTPVTTAKEVALFIIHGYNNTVDNLRLQKILYFFWMDYYKKCKKELFGDRIEAWAYGPVIPNVYYRYRSFIASPIKDSNPYVLSEEVCRDLNELLDKYRGYSTNDLIRKSHVEGGPWYKCYKEDRQFVEIPKYSIIEYLENQAE